MEDTRDAGMRADGPALPGRRKLLGAGVALAAGSLLPRIPANAQAQSVNGAGTPLGRRKLGDLEVSSIGLGVQNMHRKYTTTVPYRHHVPQ